METIVIKRVQFSFLEAALRITTCKGQLIMLGDVRDPIRVWLPSDLITIEADSELPGWVVVTMPEWLFLKNPILAEYTDYSGV